MKVRTLMFGLVITAFSMCAWAADPKEIEAKVAELNSQSIQLLGVSLNALRYLVAAESNSYLLLRHLELRAKSTSSVNWKRKATSSSKLWGLCQMPGLYPGRTTATL